MADHRDSSLTLICRGSSIIKDEQLLAPLELSSATGRYEKSLAKRAFRLLAPQLSTIDLETKSSSFQECNPLRATRLHRSQPMVTQLRSSIALNGASGYAKCDWTDRKCYSDSARFPRHYDLYP
eukprot:scaffold15521_cov119-Cylindrotheca_fusiformis.AAC.4